MKALRLIKTTIVIMIVSMNLTACSDDDEILFTVQASMPYFYENLYVPNENGNKAISNTKIRIYDYDCENHIRNGNTSDFQIKVTIDSNLDWSAIGLEGTTNNPSLDEPLRILPANGTKGSTTCTLNIPYKIIEEIVSNPTGGSIKTDSKVDFRSNDRLIGRITFQIVGT